MRIIYGCGSHTDADHIRMRIMYGFGSHTDSDYDYYIYDTQYIQYGRAKRIVFSKIKNIIQRINFPRVCYFEIILLYTKNQRTMARDL
jgi:hypothetical protein